VTPSGNQDKMDCTGDALLTATHSIMSTYLGSMTMVLKLPLTSAASTNGLHKYNGFEGDEGIGEGGNGGCDGS
jgi:hypothetical protein